MDVEISDPQAFYRAARAHFLADWYPQDHRPIRERMAHVRACLREEDGSPNIEACAIELYDPGLTVDGAEVIESRVDR
jgi:hypothetical protein